MQPRIWRRAALLVVALMAMAFPTVPAFAVDPCDDPNPPAYCSEPPPPRRDAWISNVQLSGPSQLYVVHPSSSSGWANYAIDITIGRRTGFTGAVTFSGPFWLWERDGALHPAGDFMSFLPTVTVPAGSNTVRVFLPLRCASYNSYGQVEGTAWTDENGLANDPRSGEGDGNLIDWTPNPAEVNVSIGPRGQPNDSSNELAVTCYWVAW